MLPRSRPFYLGIAAMLVSSFYDNSRGPLLPLLADRYGLDHAASSAFVSLGSAAAFVLCLLSVRLLGRMSLAAYLRAALGMQIVAVAAAALGRGYPVLLVSGFLWGGAFAAVGVTTNLLAVDGADEADRSRRLGVIHAFYGIGSGLSGIYVARTVAAGWSLPAILLAALPLAALLFIGAGQAGGTGADDEGPAPSFAEFSSARHLIANASLSFYVLGEVLTSIWLPSYLVEIWSLPLPRASLYLTWFFFALSAGRLAGAFLIPPRAEAFARPAILVLVASCFWGGTRGVPWLFPVGALVAGPFFPMTISSFKAEFPRTFPGFVALCFATVTASLTVGHLAMGAVSDAYGLQTAFMIPPACLLTSLALDALRSQKAMGRIPAAALPERP